MRILNALATGTEHGLPGWTVLLLDSTRIAAPFAAARLVAAHLTEPALVP